MKVETDGVSLHWITGVTSPRLIARWEDGGPSVQSRQDGFKMGDKLVTTAAYAVKY